MAAQRQGRLPTVVDTGSLDGDALIAAEAAALLEPPRVTSMGAAPPPGSEPGGTPAEEVVAGTPGSDPGRKELLKKKLAEAKEKARKEKQRSSISLALAERAAATPAPGSSRRRAAGIGPGPRPEESSSESSSSEDKVQLGKRLDTTNAFKELSQRHPGKLYKRGLRNMSRFLAPRSGQVDGGGLQGHAVEYLTTVSSVANGAVSMRNERELRTLAEGVDLLASGSLGSLGDVLMQRFRAVETSVQETGSWELARHLEAIPPSLPSTLSEAERAQALAMKQRERKAAAILAPRARSPS